MGDIDYARVIHSASFRRLQGKTQILNLGDSDFYRTRLTHSLEVAQIAGGIARQLEKSFSGPQRDVQICRTAGLHSQGLEPGVAGCPASGRSRKSASSAPKSSAAWHVSLMLRKHRTQSMSRLCGC